MAGNDSVVATGEPLVVSDNLGRPWAFLPELDGLRAVSVLLVLVSHLGFGIGKVVPGGLGVTVFFFISGFIITRLQLAEIRETGTVSLRNFYLRRFLRLAPALFVYLAVSLGFFWLIGWRFVAAEPLSVLFYYANYYQIFVGFTSVGQVLSPLGVLWSLSVEEHFYLLFPLLLLVFAGRVQRLTGWLCLAIAAALAWRVWLCAGGGLDQLPYDRMFKSTDTRFDSILFGCVASLLLARHGERLVRMCAHPLAIGAALLALLVSLAVRDPVFRETFRYSLQGLSCAVLVVALVFTGRLGAVSTLLRSAPMAYIGKISYSLYMYHWLAVGMMAWLLPQAPASQVIPAIVVASLLMSMASYHGVERPTQRLRKRFQAH